MKKLENLQSNLFKKFEKENVENLNSVFGGILDEASTEQAGDVSDSGTDCTGDGCTDSTKWNTDSTSYSDSSREAD